MPSQSKGMSVGVIIVNNPDGRESSHHARHRHESEA